MPVQRSGLSLTLFLLFTFATYNQNAFAEITPHPFVVSGVIVNSGNAKVVDRFVKLLSQQTGYPMKPLFVSSYAQLSEVLQQQPDAIGWTCGAPFVEDHKEYGQQLIDVPLFHGQPRYHSLVLARSGSNERALADFKDKVLAYSDPRSNSGYLAPAYALHQHGIDIKKHFRLLINSGNHERSIEALQGGLADVAAVDEYVWVEYLRAHPEAAKTLREVERFGPFPFTPIVAGPAVKKEDIAKFRKTLATLKESPEGSAILKSFGLDGFVEEPLEFYAPIEAMLKSINTSQSATKR